MEDAWIPLKGEKKKTKVSPQKRQQQEATGEQEQQEEVTGEQEVPEQATGEQEVPDKDQEVAGENDESEVTSPKLKMTRMERAAAMEAMASAKTIHLAYNSVMKVQQAREGTKLCQTLHDLKSYAMKRRRQMDNSGPGSSDLNEDIKFAMSYPGHEKYPHVKAVMTLQDKLPVVILFSVNQMKNVARFCAEGLTGAGVLAIDKTFNVGPFHITTACFQHKFLIKRKTGQHPVFLAAAMIHR